MTIDEMMAVVDQAFPGGAEEFGAALALLNAQIDLHIAGSRQRLAAVKDMASLGLAMEKSWLTVGDNRVSDGCAENEGAGWIPLDEPFPSGDQAPLRFPGCRCTALYRRVGSG